MDAGETYSATSTEEKIATKKEGQELFSERNASDEKQFNPEGKTLDEQLEDILHTADSLSDPPQRKICFFFRLAYSSVFAAPPQLWVT